MEYPRHPNTACTFCQKPIYKRPSQQRKNNGHAFCSLACYGQFCRKEKPCVVCGRQILARFQKKTCSRTCSNIHRAGIKYKVNRPKDKVKHERSLKLRLLRLRGTSCEKCGYSKFQILHVHHKDHNHSNNDIGNLELICPNCHYEEHFLEKSWLNGYNLEHKER